LAGSKFRAARLEAISDVCDFIQAKVSQHDGDRNEIQRQQRQHHRQSKIDIRLSGNIGQDIRHDMLNQRQQHL
jgi:hypothetical protein